MSQIRKPDLQPQGAGYARMDSLPVQIGENPEFISGALTGKAFGEIIRGTDKNYLTRHYPDKNESATDKRDGRASRNWSKVRELPEQWTGEHFMIRLIWAYKTLALCPGGKNAKPKEYGTAWPQYSYKFEDLVAQASDGGDAIETTRNERNHVRPVVTGQDITRMDRMFDTVYRLSSIDPATASMLMAWAYARYRNISVDLVAARYNVSKKNLYEKISSFANSCAINMIERKLTVW
jgi:hypothetical protein